MNNKINKMVISAMMMAVGFILPFFTGQIPEVGSMLLPMHIPVFLCGLICGWRYGLVIGAALPILRSIVFGMPIMFPMAISMAFELAAYGMIAGFLYNHSKWKCIKSLYKSLILAMIAGRFVWGIIQGILLGIGGNAFTWKMFLSGTLMGSIPGIIVQLLFIPAIMVALDKTKIVPFSKMHKNSGERKDGVES